MANQFFLYEVWIRKYEASCSHTETVYIKAQNDVDAWERAERLLSQFYTVKCVVIASEGIPQDKCPCGDTITWEV